MNMTPLKPPRLPSLTRSNQWISHISFGESLPSLRVQDVPQFDPVPPRFSTKPELFLDLIGLVCAVGAGAAQASPAIRPSRHKANDRLPSAADEFGLRQTHSGLRQFPNHSLLG